MKKRLALLKEQSSFFVAIPALVWQALFLYIPLFFIFCASFFKQWFVFTWSDFTLENFSIVLTSVHARIILWSLLQSFGVAVVCLLLGYPVAYFFAVRMRRWKDLFLFFLTLPFWTNFLVQAYAWFFILERDGLLHVALRAIGIDVPIQILHTPIAVFLVMVYCYLPFMIVPLYSVLEKFNASLLEASADLGATPAKTFFKVTFPLTMSGVRTGFFLVLVPAFGEYAIPAIVGGGKRLYAGGLIASYFLEVRKPALGAAFTVLSGMAILLVVLLLNRILAVRKVEEEQ